jgi:hypothetical protein
MIDPIKAVLIITTENRKTVFERTRILNIPYFDKCEFTVVTNPKDVDIFSSLISKNIKVYPLNAKSFLVIENRKFEHLFDHSTTEFGSELALRIIQKNDCGWNNDPTYYYDYCIEKLAMPIDVVHSSIRRKGKKSLIGIIIGEDEKISVKPDILFISDLINSLVPALAMDCQIFLFATKNNVMRSNLVLRDCKYQEWISSFIVYDDIRFLTQAFSLLDLVIGYDSFRTRVSIANGTKTIFLFSNTDPKLFPDYKNLKKISVDKKAKCIPCNQDLCALLTDSSSQEETCFSLMRYKIPEIIKTTKEILIGGA